ncbi:Sterol 3-beta-glucosyltransferase [Neopestalotiopsis sp. 37M]|nr:Sterol 3-beta-glucosyltransferase [Neopestalotiopsis sp. 37M]
MAPTPPDVRPSSEEATRRRVNKKLHKKRREEHQPTMELPDRLKETGDEADEDVLPQQGGHQMFMNMNQSIFGLIAAAGSTADFNDRFEEQYSDEDEAGDQKLETRKGKGKGPEREDIATSQILRKASPEKTEKTNKKHRRRLSAQLLHSLPQLPRLTSKSKSRSSKLKSPPTEPNAGLNGADAHQDAFLQEARPSNLQSPNIEVTATDRDARAAPVMSRMLEARAEMAARPSFDLERLSSDLRRGGDAGENEDTELAVRLKEIFEFDQPEKVLEEYPCWLLQSVLLQGYMYITARHICFYAYLPKKAHEVAKSGYLSKSGKRNPKYNRYWFRLKGDVLGYYRDSSNLYFPSGQIDLRYAISANIVDKEKDGVHFSIVTEHRTYHFKADSAPSAKEWVKSLQRVIFRSHNDGDSVKISLPISNVLDIEETQMLEFADTIKIRIIDNEETFAIDEYLFSFFGFGKEAVSVLKILVEDAQEHQKEKQSKLPIPGPQAKPGTSSGRSSLSASKTEAPGGELRSTKVRENVKATLAPVSPSSHRESMSRASGELSRGSFDGFRPFARRSVEMGSPTHGGSVRRSFSGSRSRSRTTKLPQENPGSSDSYVQSLEDPSLSNMVASSSEDQTGSQILRDSQIFQRPTIYRRSTSGSRLKPVDDARHANEGLPYHPRHAATTGYIAEPASDEKLHPAATTPTLQNIAKMGSYPLQRAGFFADYLNQTSRKMGSLLATESMGYVEKVSGMWKGGRKHYHDPNASRTDEEFDDEDVEGGGEATEVQLGKTMERFRNHFALPETEKLRATFFGFMIRVLPLYGKIYVSDRYFCFRSLLPGTRTKLILPIRDIETCYKEKGFRFGYSGLVLVIRGHEELFFEFNQVEVRDDCNITMLKHLEAMRYLKDSEFAAKEEQEQVDDALAERNALNEARQKENTEHEVQLPQQASFLGDASPTILFDDPKASFLNFKPASSLKITCLTIGSRGDVQPYIALCKGLLAEGHRAKIATHAEFKDWVEGHGIEFAPVAGDPGELMRLCIQNGTFTFAFLKEANTTFRSWLDELLVSAYEGVKGSDVLIESPSTMAGIHVAEALQIPYFRAFTMPWTRTRAYPHAFIVPNNKMGGAYNYMTYVMFDTVFWKAMAGQVNRWRKTTLGLPPTNLEKMAQNKVPFLYNFSPSVVAPPLDFSDWIRVTGYWFLNEGTDWTPPDDLRLFIEQARKDGKKLVYVGFGSIVVSDPAKMTQEVIDAVLKADVRCVLSKGWSDRMGSESSVPEPKLPPEIFQIKSAPHDWLFAQMDAAAHHGGSGTTGASLRAGIPTIIRPFFGDQFFYGARVEDLGVGICLKKWGVASFARALWEACNSERIIVKARVLGEAIRKENGVDTAIQAIYRDLEYARSLVVAKAGKHQASKQGKEATSDSASEDEEEEESWTFVGNDDDFETELIASKSALVEAEQLARESSSQSSTSLASRILGSANTSNVATTSKA